MRKCPPAANWPNSNQVTTALAFGPWAFWKLNEANGVTPAVDSSGHGRSLPVRVASVLGGRSGIVPTSADTSSFVIWNAATNLFPWGPSSNQTWTPAVGTWEYWINTGGHSGNETDLGCMGTISGTTTRMFRHYITSAGQPVCEFVDTANTIEVATFAVGVNDNSTHHLVFVIDGTNVSCYLDGSFVASQPQTLPMKAPFTGALTLGMPAGGAGSRFYTGLIEHVGWYDQVLSAANILSLYRAGTVLPS